MKTPCFFCDIQLEQSDEKFIIENEYFFARFDDFPVSKGHAQVIVKDHIASLFDLSLEQSSKLFPLITQTKKYIEKHYTPDAYTIGINDGLAAGQSISHLHVHIIPRYIGDVAEPRGGIRNIFPDKGDYTPQAKQMPSRKKYISE